MTDSNTAVTFLPAGNVCTPKGFRASGIHCGLRRNKTKKDLALIASDVPAAAAADDGPAYPQEEEEAVRTPYKVKFAALEWWQRLWGGA